MKIQEKLRKLKKPQIFIILFFLCIIIATVSFSIGTQQYAKSQQYNPLLDKDKIIGNYYSPFAVMQWRKDFNQFTPQEFKNALTIPFAGTLLAFTILFIGAMIMKNKKTPESHGSARWATDDEFETKDMTKPEGIMLGVTKGGNYIRHNGPEHVICYAPTRSGKGVGICIPTLLSWKHSVMVTDIKGENWAITAGFRQKVFKNKVLKFDPTCTDGSGARFNPLEEIRIRTKNEVKDTQRIVNMIVDPQGKGELDHWGKTAGALLTGLILYVLYMRPNKSLAEVASIINDPNEADIGVTLKRMADERHTDEETLIHIYGEGRNGNHNIIWNSLQECANKPADERGSVISTAVSNLALYRDPIIADNISKSDFKIADLMNYDVPVSLYIVIPPSDLDRVVPLTRIIINQIITTLTERMKFVDAKPVADYKHKLLLLIDELPAFGRMDVFEKSLAFIAGYGLKALLIVQSLNQLNKIYTRENSILDNMHIQVAYTPNDNTTAEEISKALDTATIMVTSQSYEKGMLAGARKSGLSEQARKLMTPGELRTMPFEDELVFVAGINPYKAKKIMYYKDANFAGNKPYIGDIYEIDTICAGKIQVEIDDFDLNKSLISGEIKNDKIELIRNELINKFNDNERLIKTTNSFDKKSKRIVIGTGATSIDGKYIKLIKEKITNYKRSRLMAPPDKSDRLYNNEPIVPKKSKKISFGDVQETIQPEQKETVVLPIIAPQKQEADPDFKPPEITVPEFTAEEEIAYLKSKEFFNTDYDDTEYDCVTESELENTQQVILQKIETIEKSSILSDIV